MRRRLGTLHLLGAAALGLATTVTVSWILACMDISDLGVESAQTMRPAPGAVFHSSMLDEANSLDVSVYSDPGRTVVQSWCVGPTPEAFFGIADGPSTRAARIPPEQ